MAALTFDGTGLTAVVIDFLSFKVRLAVFLFVGDILTFRLFYGKTMFP